MVTGCACCRSDGGGGNGAVDGCCGSGVIRPLTDLAEAGISLIRDYCFSVWCGGDGSRSECHFSVGGHGFVGDSSDSYLCAGDNSFSGSACGVVLVVVVAVFAQVVMFRRKHVVAVMLVVQFMVWDIVVVVVRVNVGCSRGCWIYNSGYRNVIVAAVVLVVLVVLVLAIMANCNLQ
ncbi:Hypothetical predicted protein [Octopus vulgaris]|uniref:Uncharacterized protein n=1 Tax=Octopus vulgaris TaxID=6645 RepID=A0AA36AX26_OCTVU|nr:Hypothetical predicted protein [Octopus vulgaris]